MSSGPACWSTSWTSRPERPRSGRGFRRDHARAGAVPRTRCDGRAAAGQANGRRRQQARCVDEPERLRAAARAVGGPACRFYAVSAATGEGLPALLEAVWQAQRAASAHAAPSGESGVKPRARAPERAPSLREDGPEQRTNRHPRRDARSDPRRPHRLALAAETRSPSRGARPAGAPSATPYAAARPRRCSIASRWRRSPWPARPTRGWLRRRAARVEGPSYTAQTLERLARARALGRGDVLHHRCRRVCGNRNLEAYPEVLDLANFVVVSRPGEPDEQPAVARMPSVSRSVRLRPRESLHGAPDVDFPGRGATPNVSSTNVRRRLRGARAGAGPRATGRRVSYPAAQSWTAHPTTNICNED